MSENEVRQTISTCNKSRNSTWSNGSSRSTTKGMKMVVTVSGKGSNRKSVTTYEAS